MIKIINIFFVIVISLLAVSCRSGMDEFVTTDEDRSSLYEKGNPVVLIEESQMQYSYNAATLSYRTMDDKMSNYFSITLNTSLSGEGQVLRAKLKYVTPQKSKELKELEYQVLKMDSNGLVWLWNSSRKIKVIIRQI